MSRKGTTRRHVGAGLIGLTLAGQAAAASKASSQAISPLPGTRRWLGPDFWANRLQDWSCEDGRAVCRPMSGQRVLSTAAIVSLDWNVKGRRARIETSVSLNGSVSGVAAGFLVGAGSGLLDHRAASLVQGFGGSGGGLLAVLNSEGYLCLKDHTNESAAETFADLITPVKIAPSSSRGTRLILELRRGGAKVEVMLRAVGPDGTLLGEIGHSVETPMVAGNFQLCVSGAVAASRVEFGTVTVSGDLYQFRNERRLEPILSALHSVSGDILKLSVQCFPIGPTDPRQIEIQTRISEDAEWSNAVTSEIGIGYVALFRLTGWDAAKGGYYRVVYEINGVRYSRSGRVRPEPANGKLNIGLFSCVAATFRQLDGPVEKQELPQARFIGRFSPECFAFPHAELTKSASLKDPDLLVFCGDQFYEQFPTRSMSEVSPEGSSEELCLDGLYKWYLWCWAFRELTSDRPSILLMDDHDYFQPNYWGNGGRAAPQRDHNRGGYTRPVEYVQMIERCETAHNPDAFDPTPVDQGIGVYYSAFCYGGVSFAVLEDRKFKTAILQGPDMEVYEGQLLGDRQERFLELWRDIEPEKPKIVLTQTIWSCAQTSPQGNPLIDFDSNGFPPLGRRAALSRVRDAGAIILSGDQHMASLVRQGIDTFDDGPLQFTGPAGGCGWQRWFEPAHPLANARPGVANTGDFRDGFGNMMRVLAVANPKVSFSEYRQHKKGRTQRIMDRNLKREGFGLVRIDRARAEVTLECWPWNVGSSQDARQYEGWPYTERLTHLANGQRKT